MKKVLFTGIFTGLILLNACTTNNGDIEVNSIEDTDDLQKLIETNEYLVQKQSELQEENEALKDRISSLEEENGNLKDDILTYRQQIHQLDNDLREELQIRNYLDELAKDILQAMHERDHSELHKLVHSNVQVNSLDERLEISDSDNHIYTFHYISLDSVNYVRQVDFEYNKENNMFQSRYTLYSSGGKDMRSDGDILLTFTFDNEWKLYSIMYNR
ncbi:hypothetical protein ACERII_01130 [Evansella sp. AB-rgal1]|uniref:cell division protein ZapB n=1 Tax=Evansella sp. AB-rgal1 TaxID=3242696 RepID=UPI00359D7DA0